MRLAALTLLLLASGATSAQEARPSQACTSAFSSDADLAAFILQAGDDAAALDSATVAIERRDAALARIAATARVTQDSLQSYRVLSARYGERLVAERDACDRNAAAKDARIAEQDRTIRRQSLRQWGERGAWLVLIGGILYAL